MSQKQTKSDLSQSTTKKNRGRSPGQLVKKSVSASKRAGVVFPVGRIRRLLRKGKYADRVGVAGPIYLAAVIEYLCAEILELAGVVAKEHKRKTIFPRHIMLSIRTDEELNNFMAGVLMPEVGVLPHINPTLLPKNASQSLPSQPK
uniref:Histone H2A n=1 Tax=Acrobeloides nanus TaxID=290746 RepID=A0A914C7G2_9BILA